MDIIYSRIQYLRNKAGLTQSELAKKLGVTRACVNAWEMGVSRPSIQSLVDIATLFDVSTDYILGIEKTSCISLSGLDEVDIEMIYELIDYIKKRKNPPKKMNKK